MELVQQDSGFEIFHDGHVLIRHSETNPFLSLGTGKGKYRLHKGNFTIEDDLLEKIPLVYAEVLDVGESTGTTYQFDEEPHLLARSSNEHRARPPDSDAETHAHLSKQPESSQVSNLTGQSTSGGSTSGGSTTGGSTSGGSTTGGSTTGGSTTGQLTYSSSQFQLRFFNGPHSVSVSVSEGGDGLVRWQFNTEAGTRFNTEDDIQLATQADNAQADATLATQADNAQADVTLATQADNAQADVTLATQADNTQAVAPSNTQVNATLASQEAHATTLAKLAETVPNRVWIRIPANPNEHVYGLGEQFSHFDLRGKRFPIWVSEQGVGRNKASYETFLADKDGAGGDYYTTYFPQPTFVSSERYFLHVEDAHYMEFDFRNPADHVLQVWAIPKEVVVGRGQSFPEVIEKLSGLLGRQPNLPEWAYNGVWLGLQGGTETVRRKLGKAKEKGVQVAAVWAQDWEGKRVTSFGKQLMWNWKWDKEWYPGLDDELSGLSSQNIRFLGYINCFLALEGDLYQEARKKGYLVREPDTGEPYHIVITAFPAALVDLTNPDAVRWIKRVIQREMIDFGLSGWMADFGEYLPTDAVLYNGSAEEYHNRWPALWAKVNREAVEEAGKLGDVVFFTRSGYSHSARYTTLVWAGDQNVDWSPDDGLPSVITAALSAGMSGIGLHHSDIGGYTTLFHMKRSKELFMRWAEQAAFTAIMRTHEGNRPDDNWQFDGDDETLRHFARMSQVHVALSPYLRQLVHEVTTKGLPVVRPLFFYHDEPGAYEIQTQYLFGQDLLVAPILEEGATNRQVFLPSLQSEVWVHLWTGEVYYSGERAVDAPMGFPPVFYRSGSVFTQLFEEMTEAFGTGTSGWQAAKAKEGDQ